MSYGCRIAGWLLLVLAVSVSVQTLPAAGQSAYAIFHRPQAVQEQLAGQHGASAQDVLRLAQRVRQAISLSLLLLASACAARFALTLAVQGICSPQKLRVRLNN